MGKHLFLGIISAHLTNVAWGWSWLLIKYWLLLMFPRVYSEVVVGQQINVLEIVVNTVDKPKVQLVKKMFKHVVLENGNIVTIK